MLEFMRQARDEGASSYYLDNLKFTLNYILQGDLTIEDFNSPNVQEKFCEAHSHRVWKSSTLEGHLTRLCTFGNYLCQQHVTNCRHRPPHRIKRAKQRELLTAEELQRLIHSLEQRAKKPTLIKRRIFWERSALMVRVWIETGIRNQECLDIRLEDFSQIDGQHYLYVRGTKSESAKRTLKISEALAIDCLSFAERHGVDGLIFQSIFGKRIRRDTVGKWLKKYCAELGIHCEVTPHTLRYYFIIQEIARGTSAIELMTKLGHSDVGMTVSYFNQVRRMMPWLPLSGDVALLERRQQFWQNRNGSWPYRRS